MLESCFEMVGQNGDIPMDFEAKLQFVHNQDQ